MGVSTGSVAVASDFNSMQTSISSLLLSSGYQLPAISSQVGAVLIMAAHWTNLRADINACRIIQVGSPFTNDQLPLIIPGDLIRAQLINLYKASVDSVLNNSGNPLAGTFIGNTCVGTDYMIIEADGHGGQTQRVIEANSATHCGYVNNPTYPADGTYVSSHCVGYNYYNTVANGSGGTREVLVEANSATHCNYVAPTYPADGTYISSHCVGYNYYNTVANGSGGTREVLVEANSATHCGYVNNPTYPADGTYISSHCVGYNYYDTVANGSGGTREVLVESNSATYCNYVAPTPAGVEMSTRCSGYDLYHTLADGNYGTYEKLKESNSATCGYAPTANYDYATPGEYWISGINNVSTASVQITGGSGGGGGGGKGGHDTDNDHAEGGPGSGGGGGGRGQTISRVINFPVGTAIRVVVGGGGAGGAGATEHFNDNSWKTGMNGSPGGHGVMTSIYDVNGTLLAQTDRGIGGTGGAGGHIDFYTFPGGSSGAGYPAGYPGGWVLFHNGFVEPNANYTLDPKPDPSLYHPAGTGSDQYSTPYPEGYWGYHPVYVSGGSGYRQGSGGAGGNNGGPGNGGQGGTWTLGIGSNGATGQDGRATIVMNSTSPIGSSGPGYSVGVASISPGPSYTYIRYEQDAPVEPAPGGC